MGLSNRASQYGAALSEQTLTVDATTAQGLTVPATAVSALITAGANPVRWRSAGVSPTSTVGHYLAANANLEIFGVDLNAIKFISTTATSDLIITYFKD